MSNRSLGLSVLIVSRRPLELSDYWDVLPTLYDDHRTYHNLFSFFEFKVAGETASDSFSLWSFTGVTNAEWINEQISFVHSISYRVSSNKMFN